MTNRQEVLIATVGTEPQVVTLVLDSLLAKGCAIEEVVLLHTGAMSITKGIEKIRKEIGSEMYPPVSLKRVLITDGENVLDDFRSINDINVMSKAIFKTIKGYKQRGLTVNLSIAGGRKVMGILAMAAAQMLFKPEDRLWYFLTEGWQPGDKQEMHISDHNSHLLIEIPVMRWEKASILLGVEGFANPMEIIHWQERLDKNRRMQRRREFVEHWLSKAERLVTELVCQGWDNAAIAQHLNKQERTVANQMTSIYAKLDEWLGFPDYRVVRSILIAELAPYFALGIDNTG